MDDNEIVRALECCAKCDCNKCEYFGKSNFCIAVNVPAVINLINRQKAEIENLKDILFDAEGVNLVSYWHQQCKITENGCKNYAKENKNLKAEIERLKRKLVGYEPSIDSGLFSQMLLEQKEKAEAFEKKWKAEVKSEAYREFVERLEKELFIKQNERREHWMETLNQHRCTKAYKDYEWSIDNWLRGYGEAVQDILAINQNFLKELVGEDDG